MDRRIFDQLLDVLAAALKPRSHLVACRPGSFLPGVTALLVAVASLSKFPPPVLAASPSNPQKTAQVVSQQRSTPPAAVVRPVVSSRGHAVSSDRTRRPQRTAAGARPEIETLAAGSNALVGIVSLTRQQIAIFDGTREVARAPISSGKQGHRTPRGVFSVIERRRFHMSNLYENAPMPFMQRLTWSGIALHEGKLPGFPASAGCIRLPGRFAQDLFRATRLGTRIVVSDQSPTPRSITSALLPQPQLRPDPSASIEFASVSVTVAGKAGAGQATVRRLADPSTVSDLPAPEIGMPVVAAEPRLLNPVEYAGHELRRALAALRDAEENAEALLAVARQTADYHSLLRHELSQLDASVETARLALAIAMGNLAGVESGSEDFVQHEASIWAAEQKLEWLAAEKELAAADEVAAAELAMAAAVEARDGIAEREAAEVQMRISRRAAQPVSILISRRTKQLYVRQGFVPILTAHVDIADDEQPIGTHVFTAVRAGGGGTELEWTALSLPTGPAQGSAEAALKRVSLPYEITAFLTRRVWIGSSLVISDLPPSRETGRGTDFILLTE